MLTPTERTLAALWSEVLQIEGSVGANEDFFDLGGNSMTLVMIEFRVLEELAVQLPTGALLSTPTIRELAALIDSQLK